MRIPRAYGEVSAAQFNALAELVEQLAKQFPLSLAAPLVGTFAPNGGTIIGMGARTGCGNFGDPRTVLGSVIGTRDTDAWLIDTSPNGVEITLPSDPYYAGDPTFIFRLRRRTMKFDACGRLVEITQETDPPINIFTTGLCPF